MPEDSYVPGRGKELQKTEAENNAYDDNAAGFIVDKTTGNLKSNNKPNWIIDTERAIAELKDDDTTDAAPEDIEKIAKPGGFGYVPDKIITEEERQKQLEEFKQLENDVVTEPQDKTMQIPDKCNQKQNIHCRGFMTMLGLNQCVHVELWGDRKHWTMWTLTNPDFEYANSIKITNMEELQKARFTLPFRVNRTILKYCPICGGDLSF